MDTAPLRDLLECRNAFAAIVSLATSSPLPDLLPPPLIPHIGEVYGRLEIAMGAESRAMASLRLAVLVHETPPERLPPLLDALDVAVHAPLVQAVVAGFGSIWKVASDAALHDYAHGHAAYLSELLLFELVHEGRPTAPMVRAAALGGLERRFARRVGRLMAAAPPRLGAA